MRIGLFSDCEGDASELEATLGELRTYAPDALVLAGDILRCPYSPDPPAETIAQLRASSVLAVPGNNDRYLIDWGTSRWEHTLWMRLRRADPLTFTLEDVRASVAQITPEDLAWLRALPEELTLDGGRGGRVYVCHGMPGNPWNSIWPSSPMFDANVSEYDRQASLRLLVAAGAELVLCGHIGEPREVHDQLPDGRPLRIIRAGGHRPPGHAAYAVLTQRGSAWDVEWGSVEVPRHR
jgi:predicted phosphodiesterase